MNVTAEQIAEQRRKHWPMVGDLIELAEKLLAERDEATAKWKRQDELLTVIARERDALQREIDRIANNERIEGDGMHSLELEHAAVLADRRDIEAERDKLAAVIAELHKMKDESSVAWVDTSRNIITYMLETAERRIAEMRKIAEEWTALDPAYGEPVTRALDEAERRVSKGMEKK